MANPINPVAVWQCNRCGYVATMLLPSTYTIQKMHHCYGTFPQADGYVYVGMMEALNDYAKAADALEKQYHESLDRRRKEWNEMLMNWPPAPCNRWSWESRDHA